MDLYYTALQVWAVTHSLGGIVLRHIMGLPDHGTSIGYHTAQQGTGHIVPLSLRILKSIRAAEGAIATVLVLRSLFA